MQHMDIAGEPLDGGFSYLEDRQMNQAELNQLVEHIGSLIDKVVEADSAQALYALNQIIRHAEELADGADWWLSEGQYV